MKNLTNHSCSHCQHLNRYQRTTHGHYGDTIKYYQRELEKHKAKRQFGMVQYLQRQIDETFEQMKQFERHASHRDYSRYAELNRRT